MKRREFTKIIGLGVLAAQTFPVLASAEALMESTSMDSKIPLGLCNYSLRSRRLNAKQLIEYAIEQNLDSVLLNTLSPIENIDSKHLSQLNKLAKSNNISLYIGAGSISENSVQYKNTHETPKDLLIEGIRVASALDSPIVGCRIGALKDRYHDGGIEAHVEAVVKVMKSVRSQALDVGVKFAFENHAGDLRSEELLALIDETGTDICGALFDPANALWALEDPLQAMKILSENIICTSARDIAVWESGDGAIFQGMAIGDGMLDFQLYTKIMAENCPGVPIHVETISNSARPIPYLTDAFWDGFSEVKAAELVDFFKLVKKGKDQKLLKPPENKDKKEFDSELQQAELLKSFNYLRKNCNVGLKN